LTGASVPVQHPGRSLNAIEKQYRKYVTHYDSECKKHKSAGKGKGKAISAPPPDSASTISGARWSLKEKEDVLKILYECFEDEKKTCTLYHQKVSLSSCHQFAAGRPSIDTLTPTWLELPV
jgi:hypothetical protein